MNNPLLEAKNISHSFDTLLFSNVNLSLSPHQSMAIIGRSGSGKSTLLHILSTFIQPNSGEVEILNQNIYTKDESHIENLRRYELGIIFQFHYLFKGMSAMRNVEIATLLSEKQMDHSLLDALEIKDYMHQKIGELSGGQQQRVSIARVLGKKPRIIFADEPTGNLDKETASLVMNVLLNYVKQTKACLVLVTHDEEMAQQCDKVYKLEGKELV